MKEVLGVKLYTLVEVGELLGVQQQTVSKYIQQGKIAARTIGGYKYVSEESIKHFLLTTD
jgi:predicted site-specific integrase-resolvase